MLKTTMDNTQIIAEQEATQLIVLHADLMCVRNECYRNVIIAYTFPVGAALQFLKRAYVAVLGRKQTLFPSPCWKRDTEVCRLVVQCNRQMGVDSSNRVNC